MGIFDEDLPDLVGARIARDAGMAIVNANATPWKELAKACILSLPSGSEGIFEDFRLIVTGRIGPPHHPNAWGAIANSLIKSGGLVPTGAFGQMQMPKSHARSHAPVLRRP